MLTSPQIDKITRFAQALLDQNRARILVRPQQDRSGFWFGGGNLIQGPGGTLYLTGRYRNAGDSRTGLHMGERGLELCIFRSQDGGQTFEKYLSWDKAALSPAQTPVLSIEGSALHFTPQGVELFVSSEKEGIGYPEAIAGFLKPGTGVWTVDRLAADSVHGLATAVVEPLLACTDPRFVHIKDPVVYDRSNGDTVLVFCTHPFSWTSSNSGYAVRPWAGAGFQSPVYDFFPRGFTWDVAMSRITCLLRVPALGEFARLPPYLLAFYDGGESVRNYAEHAAAVSRPRGYSCEELGGAAILPEADLHRHWRLSPLLPLFVSPYGTGCSRYVDVLATDAGFTAVWQQSRPDLSQPLVTHFLSRRDATDLLS